MMHHMEQFTHEQSKDLQVLIAFIRVYCTAIHADKTKDFHGHSYPGGKDVALCPDCGALVSYAVEKRRRCPLEPKPSCKNCHIHCYSKEYRTQIREIMAFSGRRMIMRGRLDYLWHYFF